MRRIALPRLAAATLLSFALPLVWVAGAHLHLCFDGLEPPVALHHLADGGNHLDHHSPQQQHADADVDFDTLLRRATENGHHAPAVAPTAAQASMPVASTTLARRVMAPSIVRAAPWFLQPPLRAPPV
jgi:hypothetical protein